MQLVEWYLHFVRRAKPTTWTFENVRHPAIRDFLTRCKVDYGYFNFVQYGVPQTRKRCLAGSPCLMREFGTDASLLVSPPKTPADVLAVDERWRAPCDCLESKAAGGHIGNYRQEELRT